MRRTRTFLLALARPIRRMALTGALAVSSAAGPAAAQSPTQSPPQSPASGGAPSSASGAANAGYSGNTWQWLDANGRRVFSDRPPPPDVPDRRILRRPASAWPDALPRVESSAALPGSGAVVAPPALVQANAPAPGSAAAASDSAAAAQEAARAAQAAARAASAAAAAEASRRRAEQERVAQARAENCSRARSALATLDSGVRLTFTNARGEREIMDEAARAAEVRRLREIMASDCAAP